MLATIGLIFYLLICIGLGCFICTYQRRSKLYLLFRTCQILLLYTILVSTVTCIDLVVTYIYWQRQREKQIASLPRTGVMYYPDTIEWNDKQSRWIAERPYSYDENGRVAHGAIQHINIEWRVTALLAVPLGAIGCIIVLSVAHARSRLAARSVRHQSQP